MNRIEHPWHVRVGAALCLVSAIAVFATLVKLVNWMLGIGG
ncbi:hypothetical protein [Henriciella sp.]|nr:hypothetical protein [Henriciella sp.]